MKKIKKLLSVGILMTGYVAVFAASPQAPVSLTTEFLTNPLGVNTLTPRFGWKNTGDRINSQTAYEIVVGTDSASVASSSTGDLWNSSKVKSSQSTLVKYDGTDLQPRTQGWWKVRVWNEKNKKSPWSEVARFGVGIVENATLPLQGEYIAMPSDKGDARAPFLRNSLSVDKKKGRIMAHVNSLGYHELYVNGVKASDNVLSPGVSQLGKRSLIVTYDITPLVNEGDNDIVVWLGQGWYKPNTYKAEYAGPVAKIEIDEVIGNNSRLLLKGDKSWKAAESGRHDTGTWWPLQFGGEKVDGRVTPTDLSASSLDHLNWVVAATPAITSHIASPEMSGNNRIVKRSPAESVKILPDGKILVDMGRVLTGWFNINFDRMSAGKEVLMEYADNLTSDGGFEPQESDLYVTAGRAGESFCNKFNHHAYRYVRISGLDYTPAPGSMFALQIHGDMPDASSFKCSDESLNAVHDMIKYTMKCLTFSGYMVDCPHLERTGYGGDGNSSTMTLQTMYDVAPTYANWLQAWSDVMEEDGGLPHVAPAGGGGGGPYWCGFIVLAPYRTWLNYGDPKILEDYYPLMKKWMGYVEKYSPDVLLQRWPDTHNRAWYLGDWLAPIGVDAGNEASVNLVNNCFISDCLAKMEHIAGELGLDNEAMEWKSKREKLNARIHSTFFDDATSTYATGSQLDMSYPLLVGVTPEHLRESVEKKLLELARDKDRGHIGAGLVGVPIVTEWAINSHNPDFIATMLRHRDYPGYLYMIDNGATATWEYWNGERSRVHNCYNGIGLWFYQGLGGLIPDKAGYEHFIIDPQPAAGVEWAAVSKATPKGEVKLRWDRTDSGLTYDIVIPVGCNATVRVPEGMTTKGYKQGTDGIELSNGHHRISFIK